MADNHLSRRAVIRRTALTAAAAPAAATAQAPARPASNAPLNIVTMTKFQPSELAKFTNGQPVLVNFTVCETREEFREKLRTAEVVYGPLTGADLDFAPSLKWLQAASAGVESMDPKILASPLTVTNMARVFAPGITETAIGLLLCLTRGITTYYHPQFLKREMKPVGNVLSPDHTELAGRTMAIAGFGGIGSILARRAYYGFDMKILATDAKPLPKPEYVSELRDPGYFMDMVPQADVLVAACPLTPKTRKMFNEDVFRRMKKTAIFLGLSRGEVFDDMALVKALKEGWIAGAGLDVFPQEPPPATHPIFDLKNVVMTAHTSGWGPDRQRRLVDLFAENIRRYAAGLPMYNVVDKEKGY
jgi:phosphoglycerate dehydrogenase-like enzyme